MLDLSSSALLTAAERSDLTSALDSLSGRPVLLVLAGSRAHGLAHPASDLDVRGAYLAPTTTLLGLGDVPQTVSQVRPVDLSLHELGRLVRLALDADLGALEALFSPVLLADATGRAVLAARHLLLSQRARPRYLGYASAQLKQLAREHATGRDPSAPGRTANATTERRLRHVFRLLEQGRALLATGEPTVAVADPVALVARSRLPFPDAHALARTALEELATLVSPLPLEPDVTAAEELLLRLRLDDLASAAQRGQER